MLITRVISKLFGLILAFIITGCASQSNHFIPKNLPEISEGMSRIVVSREKQLSGMTTPIYIVDIGRQIQINGEIVVRVGDWVKEPGLSVWYIPDMLSSFSRGGFMLIPASHIKFEETSLTLDEIIDQNQNAVIYVDYLDCNVDDLVTPYCGDGTNECNSDFIQELDTKNGKILETKNNQEKSRKVQVIGKLASGETLIWERKSGLMRIGSLWGAFNLTDDTLALTRGNIIVEAGKTYYLNYKISLGDQIKRGDRWTITKVE